MSLSDELLGTHEVAELLGVSRQRVHQFRRNQTIPPFPLPVAALHSGLVWDRQAVIAWQRARVKGNR